MSHDAHGAHDVHAEETTVEQSMVLASARNYVVPLLLVLVVTGLVAYLLIGQPIGLHHSSEGAGTTSGEQHNDGGGGEPTKEGEGKLPTLILTYTASPTLAVFFTTPTQVAIVTAAPTEVAGLPATSTSLPTAPTAAGEAPTTIEPTTASVAPIASTQAEPTTPAAATARPTASLPSPQLVSFGGRSFRVVPNLYLDQWQPGSSDMDAAIWAQDSAAPLIFGIPYSEANSGLFTAAVAGEQVSVAGADGAVSSYRISAKQRIAADDSTAFNQNPAPGVLLLLLGEATTDRSLLRAVPLSP